MMKRESKEIVMVFLTLFWIPMAALLAITDLSESACGAAASSCKNCHEVKGEMRVNNQGDYHTQHAFGDFCVFCHAGNTAATTKAEAHEGMVKPLANLEQSCASCHPDDYEKRSDGYGGVIKSEGSGGAGPTEKGPGNEAVTGTGAEPAASPTVASKAPAVMEVSYQILSPTPEPEAVKPENLIDYNLYWVDKGLALSIGDRILIVLSILLFMGFPILRKFLQKEKESGSGYKNKTPKGVGPAKQAADEATA